MSGAARLFRSVGPVLVVAVPALLIWGGVVRPVQAWKSAVATELEATNAELARLASRQAEMRVELDQMAPDSEGTLVWVADHEGEATARVQSAIGTLAGRHGVSLRSITPIPATNSALPDAVAVRVEAEAPLDLFAAFLIELEYQAPALLVEGASVRRLTRPDDTGEQPSLLAQLDILAPVRIAMTGEALQ